MGRWKAQDYMIIGIILVITIGLRLFLALDVPYVVGDESFHWMRQAQNIREVGVPISQDPLFAGSRQFASFPVFAYLITLPTLLGPFEIWAKIFTNLSAATVVLLAFMICMRTTDSRYVAYLTSFFAGFIPVFWQKTVHEVSIYAVVIPLFMWCIYLFIEIAIGGRKVVNWYALSLILFSIIHPSVLLLIGGLFIYLMMLKVEDVNVTKAEMELVLFSTLVAATIQVIVYKDVLLALGFEVIWQNVPTQIAGTYFAQTSLLQAFYRIGEIPVIFGIVIIAKYLFKEKNKTVYLFISYALLIATALWLRIIEPDTGMMFLGAVLVLLFSFYYTLYLDYVPSTRFHKFLPIFKTIFFLTFILTSTLPAIYLVGGTIEDMDMQRHEPALDWLRDKTPDDAIVFSSVKDGAMIAALSNRSIVMDTNFLMVPDAQHRIDEIDKLFQSPHETAAVKVMEDSYATYLYVDKRDLLRRFNSTDFKFIDRFTPSDCFARVVKGGVSLYELTCEVKVIS